MRLKYSALIFFLVVVLIFLFAKIRQNERIIALDNDDWSCRTMDYDVGFILIEKSCQGSRDLGEGPIPIQFNSHGLRGPEFAPPSNKGKPRIALMGGSMLTGPGLPESHNPAVLLESKLRQLGFPEAEVINVSVEGYTTTHQTVFFRRTLSKFQPDIVILDTFNSFKPFRDYSIEYRVVKDSSGEPLRLRTSREEKALLNRILPNAVNRHIFLANHTFHYLEASRRVANIEDEIGRAKEVLRPTIAYLHFMEEFAKLQGVRIFLMHTGEAISNRREVGLNDSPWVIYLTSLLLKPFEIPGSAVKQVLSEEGFQVLNVAGEFSAKDDRRFYIADTYYFSEEGMSRHMDNLATELSARLTTEQ